MSAVYFELHPEIKFFRYMGWEWAEDDEWLIFPPVKSNKISIIPFTFSDKNIWCDFFGMGYMDYDWLGGEKQFLDYEYLYNPVDFKNMVGGRWEKFRKNCRKWPKVNEGYIYTKDPPRQGQIATLLLKWIQSKGGEIEDADFIVELANNTTSKDVQRYYLYKSTGELVAFNIADENWMFINYRLLVADPDEIYIDEFMRWKFYTSNFVAGKIVNDGGSMGFDGLENFKDHMNPIYKNKRYSIINKK